MSLTQALKKLVEDPMFYYSGFEMSENHPDREDHNKRTRRDEDCGCDDHEEEATTNEDCGCGDNDEDDDTPEEYIVRKPI